MKLSGGKQDLPSRHFSGAPFLQRRKGFRVAALRIARQLRERFARSIHGSTRSGHIEPHRRQPAIVFGLAALAGFVAIGTIKSIFFAPATRFRNFVIDGVLKPIVGATPTSADHWEEFPALPSQLAS